MRASDYRAEARLALKGKWGAMALLELVAAAVAGVLASIFVIAMVLGPLAVSAIQGLDQMINGATAVTTDNLVRLPASFYVLLLIGILLVGAAISLLTAGLYRASCAVARGRTPQPSVLFPLELLFRAVAMNFVRAAIVGVGLVLLVVPGLIAAYRYAMADYLLVTRRRMGPIEALRASAALMKGRQLRLFFVHLSMYALQIVCAAPLIVVQIRIRAAALNGMPSSLSLLTAPLALLAAAAGLFLSVYMRVASTIFFREVDREERRRARGELDEGEPGAASEGGIHSIARLLRSRGGKGAPERAAPPQERPRDAYVRKEFAREDLFEEEAPGE